MLKKAKELKYIVFYKMLKDNLVHNDFQYKLGINEDIQPFNPKGSCEIGGFALQYVKEQTPEICIEAVKQIGLALQLVKEQTPEICIEAVKQTGLALKYVKEQTPKICMEAVKQDGMALRYVKEQTPEICMEAFKNKKYFVI